MPTLARCALLGFPLLLTAGTALAEAAQDCKDATLTAEERQTACRTAVAEAASYTELARTHLNAGHPEDGLVAARRAIEIAALLTLRSPEEARAAANRMVDLGPRYEPAQGLLLQALAETGAVDDAMAAYSEAQAAGIEDTGGTWPMVWPGASIGLASMRRRCPSSRNGSPPTPSPWAIPSPSDPGHGCAHPGGPRTS